jgi:hypothetical protein
MGGEAVLSEVIEKMRLPAPGSMQRSMYEKERYWVRVARRILGNDFKFHGVRLPGFPSR